MSKEETGLTLEEVTARYEGLLRAAVEAIIVIDGAGRIETFSKGAERIFGYLPDEVVGKNVNVLMPRGEADRHDGYIENFHQSRQPKIIGTGREVEGRHKSGRIFPMDLSIGEIESPTGRKFVGVARDITRRRAAEQALRAREEETMRIINHAPVGILTTDFSGLLLSLNPALKKLLKVPDSSFKGRPLTSLFHPDSKLMVEAALRQVATGAEQVQIPDLRIQCLDGSEAVGILYLEAIRSGGMEQIIGQVLDRTKEIETNAAMQIMREELAHAARLSTLGEMASAIAHEINQPLTAIATQAQAYRRMVADSAASPTEIASSFDEIAEQAIGISQVVKRIRAFVTKRESVSEVLKLEKVLVQVLKISELDSRQKDVSLDLEVEDSPAAIRGDSIQLQQVMLNLIRNAIDACSNMPPDRRRVIVQTRYDSDKVILSVADRGPGILPENQKKLFLPFFTTKEQGLGLGLSLSHSIIESHGGNLTYRENPDGGAIFEIRLPAHSSQAVPSS